MRRKKYIFIFLLLIFIGLIYFLSPIPNYECPPPERPTSVPLGAKWCGGCDGGNWILLIEDEIKCHFKVFTDYTGLLLMDAIFLPENDRIDLNQENWQEKVWAYEADSDSPLTFILLNDSNKTKLISQYPAFGGLDWEIISEKYYLNNETNQ